MDGDGNNEEYPLGFPIQYIDVNVHMKNIPPPFLSNFHGMRLEDVETFLFEFQILFRYYGYLLKTQKFMLFLETIEG